MPPHFEILHLNPSISASDYGPLTFSFLSLFFCCRPPHTKRPLFIHLSIVHALTLCSCSLSRARSSAAILPGSRTLSRNLLPGPYRSAAAPPRPPPPPPDVGVPPSAPRACKSASSATRTGLCEHVCASLGMDGGLMDGWRRLRFVVFCSEEEVGKEENIRHFSSPRHEREASGTWKIFDRGGTMSRPTTKQNAGGNPPGN